MVSCWYSVSMTPPTRDLSTAFFDDRRHRYYTRIQKNDSRYVTTIVYMSTV